MNFSKKAQQATLPSYRNNWRPILNSADAKWNGPAKSADASVKTSTVTIEPESILIYKNSHD
jgi:maltooligosyltrehalose trehalohydrolase